MHPKNWLNEAEQDSIAKAHMRLDDAVRESLERINGARGLRGWFLRWRFPGAAILSAVHHRMLWWGTYINEGALDEQISDRVRAEAKHFWLARDEAALKLRALAQLSDRVDVKLRALDAALELTEVQLAVMNEAVPPQYKMQVRRVAQAVKRALSA